MEIFSLTPHITLLACWAKPEDFYHADTNLRLLTGLSEQVRQFFM